ncbi:hypothetical protein Y032_0780g2298 [Ancylostoma ceylanicum]|uniref:Uncharacterized protein n=2 Tax=Ancylostoma ceylanicum TaxID=53326 RepID=A0A016WD79_9BILA|nr:hypothetical protein Y032_0780g2298 [Ancylostoma ceylanicum]
MSAAALRPPYVCCFRAYGALLKRFHIFARTLFEGSFFKEALKGSTAASPIFDSCAEGRSTQTDSYPIIVAPPRRKKSEAPVNMDEIKEREALYQVIEDALGETIDRYSRLRTNQIIANSARKQGQIWRDAKEFIASQLVPQSIQLANKSRSRNKTAVEIVASIKCYP